MESQMGNKVTIIKGHCDVLVDDSAFNCYQALNVGFPAILITRPHNIDSDYPYRINKLDIKEIIMYILIVIVILLIKKFIISPIRVNGASMNDTLNNGDIMIMNIIGYKFQDIKRFDGTR